MNKYFYQELHLYTETKNTCVISHMKKYHIHEQRVLV